jgi:hypothetical protein
VDIITGTQYRLRSNVGRNAGHNALEVSERLADLQALSSQSELANCVLMSPHALL